MIKYKINFLNIFNLKNVFKIINYKFLSTFSINLVNLIWRIVFFISLENEFSGILFAIYALASFPSTIYNNTIGISVETNQSNKLLPLGALGIYYVFMLFLTFIVFNNYIVNLNNLDLFNFSIITALTSLIGSFIMIFSISRRIKILNEIKSKRNMVFRIDIIYSILNLLSLVIIYFYFNSLFFSVLFLISSILSLSYALYYNALNKNE